MERGKEKEGHEVKKVRNKTGWRIVSKKEFWM